MDFLTEENTFMYLVCKESRYVNMYLTIIYGIWVDEATKTIMATDVNNDQPILKFIFGWMRELTWLKEQNDEFVHLIGFAYISSAP